MMHSHAHSSGLRTYVGERWSNLITTNCMPSGTVVGYRL